MSTKPKQGHVSEMLRTDLKNVNNMRFTERPKKRRVVFHAVIAFALFAGCCMWIATRHPEVHKPASYLLLLGACGISLGYLLVVWAVAKTDKNTQ